MPLYDLDGRAHGFFSYLGHASFFPTKLSFH